MKYLSNLEPHKAAVTFIGCEQIMQAHEDVIRAILKYHCRDPNGSVKVYANSNPDRSPLEWTIQHSSPRGILTLNVTQRIPGGAIKFSRD